MAAADEVIDMVHRHVVQRLAALTVAEPAYAVGLYASPGNTSLDVELLAVAIGRDRTKWAEEEITGPEAVYLSWNPLEFSVQELPRARRAIPIEADFADVEPAAEADLLAKGIENPQRYVYNRVAAKLDPSELSFPVTEDFVAFVFDGPDHVETASNIRFSASASSLALLKSNGLLMA